MDILSFYRRRFETIAEELEGKEIDTAFVPDVQRQFRQMATLMRAAAEIGINKDSETERAPY